MKRFAISVILLLSLALVTYPRFNRQDVGLLKEHVVGRGAGGGQSMGDAPEYIRAVQYYRGQVSRDQLVTPFAYRVGVPYVAARLPIKDPMTALNCLNFAGLALALVFLHGTLRAIGYGYRAAVVGDFLFTCSFPVFYYGTVGLVDPVWLTVLSAGLFCLYRRHWAWLCVVTALGALVRETSLVLVVVAAASLLVTRPRKWTLTLVLMVLAYLLPTIGVRLAFHDLQHYAWAPSWGYLHQNLRFRALAAMALSFGLPGILTLVWLVRKRFRGLAASPAVWVPMLTGIVCALGLTAFAFVAAYADGRFLWAVSLFGVPFAVEAVSGEREGVSGEREGRRERRRGNG